MRAALILGLIACGSPAPPQSPPAAPTPAPPPIDAAPPLEPTSRLPDGIAPTSYDLVLELDPAKDTFAGAVDLHVHLVAQTQTIWIHASDLTITSARGATVGDKRPHDLLPLRLDAPAGPGDVTVHLEYTGVTTHDQQGLFRQKADGTWFLFSQGESVFARKIVPCFDEPRFKVPWRVTLIVPKDQVALANAPVASDTKRPDGRREVTFAEIAALPSYLLAIAVGPFQMVDGGVVGRAKIPFRVAVWPSRKKETALALKITPKLVDALEVYFDQPLPLAKLDFVAVPELFGAMEHPGLVTFEAYILLGDAGDADDRRRFTRVAAHELAHQWTGNLVTPAWWDDLWLSEAFATFLGEKVTAGLGALDDGPLRAQLDREDALAADADAQPRAIRHPIAEGDDIDDTFDAIAYEKGRAVLAMFEHHLGEDKFRDAMRAYVAAHARGSVTTADFVAALAAVSSADVGAALASLVDHAGTPIVELSVRCSARPVVVGRARDGVALPVCVRYTGGKRACGLVGSRAEIALDECPTWLVGNDGAAGYYQIAGTLPSPPLTEQQPAERLAAGDDLAGAVIRGEVAPRTALGTVDALAATRDPYAQLAAARIAGAIDPLVDDATRAAWGQHLGAAFADRLTAPALLVPVRPVERVLRDALIGLVPSDRFAPAATAKARAAVDRALAARVPDLDNLALGLAVSAQVGGAKLFDRVLARAKQAKDGHVADAMLEGLGAFGPELAPRVVDLVIDPNVHSQPALDALAGLLERPSTRSAAWTAAHAKLPALMTRLAGAERKTLIEAFGGLCEYTAREDLAAAVAPYLADTLNGPATLARTLARIDRCVARRAAAGPFALP